METLGKIEGKTWKQLEKLLAGIGKGVTEVQDDLSDLRHDVASIVTATDTCKAALTEMCAASFCRCALLGNLRVTVI